ITPYHGRHQSCPACLVAGTKAGTILTVKVLIEQDQISPVRISLEFLGASVDRAPSIFVTREGADQAPGDFLSDPVQVHHLPRCGRALDLKIVAVILVKLQQRPDDHRVYREPDRASPVRVAAEETGARLCRFVGSLVFLSENRESIRMLEVPAGKRANPVRAKKSVFRQQSPEDFPQSSFVDNGKKPAAAISWFVETGYVIS